MQKVKGFRLPDVIQADIKRINDDQRALRIRYGEIVVVLAESNDDDNDLLQEQSLIPGKIEVNARRLERLENELREAREHIWFNDFLDQMQNAIGERNEAEKLAQRAEKLRTELEQVIAEHAEHENAYSGWNSRVPYMLDDIEITAGHPYYERVISALESNGFKGYSVRNIHESAYAVQQRAKRKEQTEKLTTAESIMHLIN